jgi:DNA-nicking Smr family endonuclease
MTKRRPPSDLLSEADKALWGVVSGTVKKLPKKEQKTVVPPKAPAVARKAVVAKTETSVVAALVDKPALAWSEEQSLQRGDKKRIKQGVLRPTVRLDLHGYTVARAEKALGPFLQQAKRDGHLWAEIITGHGRFKSDSDGVEKGVLKRLLPEWLNKPIHRAVIKRVLPAPGSRGGAVWVALS